MSCHRLRLCLSGPQGPAHPLKSVHKFLFLQAFFALLITISVVFCLMNMGWWTGLKGAAILAIVASLVTICVIPPAHSAVGYIMPTDTTFIKRVRTVLGLLLVTIVFGLHLAAALLMSMKPGKDFRHSFEEPPIATWYTAIVLVGFQALVALWRGIRMLKTFLDPIGYQRSEEGLSDCDLELGPINDLPALRDRTRSAPPFPAIPIQGSVNQADLIEASSRPVSANLTTRSWPNPFWSPRDPDDESPDSRDSPGEGSSTAQRMSEKARGKQRESDSDADDLTALSLARADGDGNIWSPV